MKDEGWCCMYCNHISDVNSKFKVTPSGEFRSRRGAEIIPVKDPHTRIKPLTLASGHDLYITATPEGNLCPLENGRYI
jgi:hypothetical protein